jgi:hypothetical protein
MSEERRKRQEQRGQDESREPKATRYLTYAVILVLLVGAFLGGQYYKNHKYDAFAQCLAGKQAKMYGLYWCPHCADQKRMFGDAFHHVPYVECADGPPGSGKLAPACQAAGIKLFPSWQFGSDPPKEGVLTLDELSAKTGCTLP